MFSNFHTAFIYFYFISNSQIFILHLDKDIQGLHVLSEPVLFQKGDVASRTESKKESSITFRI